MGLLHINKTYFMKHLSVILIITPLYASILIHSIHSCDKLLDNLTSKPIHHKAKQYHVQWGWGETCSCHKCLCWFLNGYCYSYIIPNISLSLSHTPPPTTHTRFWGVNKSQNVSKHLAYSCHLLRWAADLQLSLLFSLHCFNPAASYQAQCSQISWNRHLNHSDMGFVASVPPCWQMWWLTDLWLHTSNFGLHSSRSK